MLVLSATGAPVALVNLASVDMISSEVLDGRCWLCGLNSSSGPTPWRREVGRSAQSPLPRGSADHAAKVASPEARIFVCEHVGVYRAECRLRLVPETVIEGLD